MGAGAPLKTPSTLYPPFQPMTADLATALLNRAANGAELLSILETIADDVAEANIDDAAAHWEAINQF